MTIDELKQSAFDLCEFLATFDLSLNVATPLFISKLPFFGRTDILTAVKNISADYGIDFNHYDELIDFLLTNTVPDEKKEYVVNVIKSCGIDFYNFYSDWKFGTRRSKYKDINTTIQDCYNMIDEIQSDERKNALGNAGEYIVYEQLKKDPNLEILFVSKDIGDGYGYDIVTRNKLTNHYDYIEVKGFAVSKGTSLMQRDLTANEQRIFETIDSKNNNEQYHVYLVPLCKDEDKLLYDILHFHFENNELKMESLCDIPYTTLDSTDVHGKYKTFGYMKGPLL